MKKTDRSILSIILITLALCVCFLLLDQSYNRLVNRFFPPVGDSAWLASLYGILSRLHVLIPCIVAVALYPRELGFKVGSIAAHWKLILGALALNCGLIAVYMALAGGSPYSGNQWLLTETVTVPLIEETFWRGLVFALLLGAFNRHADTASACRYTVWVSGLAFGLLHAGNALAGVPLAFAGLQALNASVWGLVYGHLRAKTGSIYPAILLHAAMNLIVVLF